MSFKIVRNDITRMSTQAIVNTASAYVDVGPGCDLAVYTAAGYEELLAYRREHIGEVPEGEVFLTPGFRLQAEFIIHAVSPYYMGGEAGEAEKLRACYRRSLALAASRGIRSIAFPLIATGGFGYPKEEGLRIAVDEIYRFLFDHEMEVILVVHDEKATRLGKKIDPGLQDYIRDNFKPEVQDSPRRPGSKRSRTNEAAPFREQASRAEADLLTVTLAGAPFPDNPDRCQCAEGPIPYAPKEETGGSLWDSEADMEELKRKLDERKAHLADSFSQYLLYLIESRGMTNAEVYKRAIVDKKLFAKIKNDPAYHPQKITCLCLCVGARLSLDETRDLLARAGYALSPCDMRDIIFSYFIERKHYDMLDIDIQLEEYDIPCIIA